MTKEGLRLKVLKQVRIRLAKLRAKKIKHTDFTIISNNCWGGMIYESYGLQKCSPTCGGFFYADDYIKFLSNLEEYLNEPLTFIKPEESKWKFDYKHIPNIGSFPIGRLKDVDIFFMHYDNEEEVINKWNRRCHRMNMDKLIVKFNDQNLCSQQNYIDFCRLPFKNKLFFTVRDDWPLVNDKKQYIKINQPGDEGHILASYEPFGKSKYIDMNEYINRMEIE